MFLQVAVLIPLRELQKGLVKRLSFSQDLRTFSWPVVKPKFAPSLVNTSYIPLTILPRQPGSHSQAVTSIRSFLHFGHSLGALPFPIAPHALHFQSSWTILQGVSRWSASMSKTRSAPSQPF